jgi:isopentenyl diphosphate isomerase/L-lactate dehydrogenase-like FMN-dependent dehydrogenase
MKQNVEELASINLRQYVLRGVGTPGLETDMGQKWAMPIALGPVGALCVALRWSQAPSLIPGLFGVRTRK